MDQLVTKSTFYDLNLRLSDEEFRDLRLLSVVRCGKTCIYVTKEDKVYGFGYNHLGCLGLGSDEEYIGSPQLNTTLSDKQLIDICFGWDHGIGLTRSGQCYAWGSNRFGRLGTQSDGISTTPLLVESLADKRVVRISCGRSHTLALTDSGQVYAWGSNHCGECGNSAHPNVFRPILIVFDSAVKAISCGKWHSLALMANGLVYMWGKNNSGQLGRQKTMDSKTGKVMSSKPLRLNYLFDEVVVKAVCGPNHTLVLTEAGAVYAFGANECGQIGNGTTDEQIVPVRVSGYLKFTDIACSFQCESSVGQSGPNEYYIWGCIWKHEYVSQPNAGQREKELKPKRIRPKIQRSLFDIFAKCSEMRMTFKTIVVLSDAKSHSDNASEEQMNNNCIEFNPNDSSIATNDKKSINYVLNQWKSSSDLSVTAQSDVYPSSVTSIVGESSHRLSEASNQTLITESNSFINRLISSFNNPNDYDIRFRVENQYIFGHKTILRIRNEKFWRKCEKYMNKEMNEIRLKQRYSYQSVLSFIQYLYTNSVTIDGIQTATDLQSLANTYGEEELNEKCQQYLDSNTDPNPPVIDLKNVCELYTQAIEQNSKELENICIEFVSKHMKQICLSQEFEDMNDSFAKELIVEAIRI